MDFFNEYDFYIMIQICYYIDKKNMSEKGIDTQVGGSGGQLSGG